MDILRHWLIKPIYGLVYFIANIAGRIVDFMGGSHARVTTIKMGSIGIVGPKTGVDVIKSAFEKIKKNDPAVYQNLISGRKCSLIGGSSINTFSFEYGLFVVSVRFTHSMDALVSLFVLWNFIQRDITIKEISNKQTLKNRVKEAIAQTTMWLQANEYPAQVVQWMEAGGLEKGTVPARTSK